MTAALAIGLFATICIDGTLHGEPKTLCREFQINHYPSVETCNLARRANVDEWLKSVAFLSPHLVAERCGPAEKDDDDI